MKIIYALLLVCLASCCALTSSFETGMPTPVRKIDAEELTRTVVRYTTRLKRERGLSLEDSRCYYTDCAERVRLVLSSQRCLEICEAREELVDVVEGLLAALNNNPIIRADLCGQYFSADNVELYISYESYFSEYIDPFYVGWTSLDQGLACYYMATLKEYYYDRWHSRVEPYFKSVEIANAQKEANLIYPPRTIDKNGEESAPVIIDTGPSSSSNRGK